MLPNIEPTVEEHILDIYSIPDHDADDKMRPKSRRSKLHFSWKDIGISFLILLLATLFGLLFEHFDFSEANIIMVYILGVLIVSVITSTRIYSLLASIISVIVFNFFFTDPRYTLLAYDKDYPVTFVVMLIAAFITGSLANQLKNQAKQSANAAYRTQILFDTSHLLEKAREKDEILNATARQLIKLFNRSIVIYPRDEGGLEEPCFFAAKDSQNEEMMVTKEERRAADWVVGHAHRAGATTSQYAEAYALYLPIQLNNWCYGVLAIAGKQPLDAFENSVLLSILGECALALENEKNAREKEQAAVLAQKEQFRANLLRSISHDLRTPLTAISGNAANLLYSSERFDEATKKMLYTDIYDDAMWLITLVENLLAVTRIEEGSMVLHLSSELIEEVIAEALKHVDRNKEEHSLKVRRREDFLLAKMDARLIIQVIINLVDNAIKYTPKGSEIVISTRKKDAFVEVEVADNGPGITDEAKLHVFDMFYSGENKIADSRRSLGLGLFLCKAIIDAHGGRITVSDKKPTGTIFTFTLPIGEVQLNE